jgi:hypothetical protein
MYTEQPLFSWLTLPVMLVIGSYLRVEQNLLLVHNSLNMGDWGRKCGPWTFVITRLSDYFISQIIDV